MLLCIVNPQESRREPESNAHACLFRAEIGAEERQDLIGKEKTAEALSGIRKKHKKTAASRCFLHASVFQLIQLTSVSTSCVPLRLSMDIRCKARISSCSLRRE